MDIVFWACISVTVITGLIACTELVLEKDITSWWLVCAAALAFSLASGTIAYRTSDKTYIVYTTHRTLNTQNYTLTKTTYKVRPYAVKDKVIDTNTVVIPEEALASLNTKTEQDQ